MSRVIRLVFARLKVTVWSVGQQSQGEKGDSKRGMGVGGIVYIKKTDVEYRKKEAHPFLVSQTLWQSSKSMIRFQHDVCVHMVSQFIALCFALFMWSFVWYGLLVNEMEPVWRLSRICKIKSWVHILRVLLFSSYRYHSGLLRNQKGAGQHSRLISVIHVRRKKGLMGHYAGVKWFCTLMCHQDLEFSTLDIYGLRGIAVVDTHSAAGVAFFHMNLWKTTLPRYHVDI